MFLECVATFTCTELCSYAQFMSYTLLTNVIILERNDLRKKIVQNVHVMSAWIELPHEQQLVQSIYRCDYQLFYQTVSSLLIFI